jgi:hypothetical protein
MPAEKPEPQPTATALVDIPVRDDAFTIGHAPLTGLEETVLADTVLPRACPVCARPGNAAQALRFLGPLPRYFRPLAGAIFVLSVVAGALAASAGGQTGKKLAAAGLLAVAVVLGLLAARAAVQRSRNVLTFFLCDEHVRAYRRLEFWRRVLALLLLLLLLFNVLWTPTVLTMIAYGAGPAGWFARWLSVGVPLALLVLAIVLYLSARAKVHRYRGLTPRLDAGRRWLKLTCRSLEFARLVELQPHPPTT